MSPARTGAVPEYAGAGNPLHSDPEFAAAAGFPRPILHGLCTYGMTCKALVDTLHDCDTARVGGYGARFAGVVFPGETLKASVWKDGDGFRAVVTAPERDNAVALAGAELIPVKSLVRRNGQSSSKRGRREPAGPGVWPRESSARAARS